MGDSELPMYMRETTGVFQRTPSSGGERVYDVQHGGYSSMTQVHHDRTYPGDPYNTDPYYGNNDGCCGPYIASSCGADKLCMGIFGLIVLAFMISGAVALGLSISNRVLIHEQRDSIAALTVASSSQASIISTLTVPLVQSTTPGVIVPSSAVQRLGCGGSPCVMTLPTDLTPYVNAPAICVYSTEPQAHTISLSGGATFQEGGGTTVTFPAITGSHFCFNVVSASVASILSRSATVGVA